MWIIRQNTDRALNGIVASAMLKPSQDIPEPGYGASRLKQERSTRSDSVVEGSGYDGRRSSMESHRSRFRRAKWMKMDKMDAMDSGQSKTGTQNPGCYRF